MGIIAFLFFWVFVVKVWIIDGARLPLFFIFLWIAGFFGVPALHLSGYAFIGLESTLAVILLLVERYKTAF